MRIGVSALAAVLASVLATAAAGKDVAPLAQSPTLNATQVVFAYGGYLWSASRAGGEARQLTHGGHEGRPIFSPDGKWIAFTGSYDGAPGFIPGAEDVYVMPAGGGEPKRLTWHPGPDIAVGWTPDSKRVLFASFRQSYARFERLYTIPVDGGAAQALPMWRGAQASFSPDAARLAYVPNLQWEPFWKRYRGGQTTPIYLVGLKDLQLEKVPRDNSNDSAPVWWGDTVYFLSDRNGPTTLFAYDTKAKTVKQVFANHGLDLKSLSAGPDALVYEQFGDVFIFDPAKGASRKVDIRAPDDLPATQPHDKAVGDEIEAASLSPSGDRVLFEAHADIFWVSTADGAAHNLTGTPAVAERSPVWSPDGRRVAYFSDASGEYALHVRTIDADAPAKTFALSVAPWFYAPPVWSPDGRKIVFQDMQLNLVCVETDTGAVRKIDTNLYDATGVAFAPVWSPDSRWIAYQKFLPNLMHAIHLYDLDTDKSAQVTDGMVDARYPAFDKGGKLLLFAASTDIGLALSWQDMSATQRPVTRSVYAAVLKDGDPLPTAQAAEPGAASSGPVAVQVDLAGIDRRTVALPVPPANYVGLLAGKPGEFFLQEIPLVSPRGAREVVSVSTFSLTAPKLAPFVASVSRFALSTDGGRALYRQGGGWVVVATQAPPKAGDGVLNLEKMRTKVEPRAEWRQMFREAWREERDYFYDPHLHGLDLVAAEKKYAPYLDRVGGRADLNVLFQEMLGDLTIGHLFVMGGDIPRIERTNVGMLGADYEVDHDRYRFARIFEGDVWDPRLQAPLGQLGGQIHAGDYLLAVNGQAVRVSADVYSFFVDRIGKPTRLTVGPDADGRGAREVVVVPAPDESDLRLRAWEEDNRRKVDALSGGKIAYVHLADTAQSGYADFNRFYFAQIGKPAAIIDERFNEGGGVADYIVDLLKRPLRHCVESRAGQLYCVPQAQIYGPKTMIINEMSGSGGDALPWMFRQAQIGPLIGRRTWGGMTSPGGSPGLMDGGGVAAPSVARYGPGGDWVVENHGIPPDMEVENDPATVAAGGDPQLEAAVQVTLRALRENPVETPRPPPFPTYAR